MALVFEPPGGPGHACGVGKDLPGEEPECPAGYLRLWTLSVGCPPTLGITALGAREDTGREARRDAALSTSNLANPYMLSEWEKEKQGNFTGV